MLPPSSLPTPGPPLPCLSAPQQPRAQLATSSAKQGAAAAAAAALADGEQRVVFANGDVYEGSIKASKRHGAGRYSRVLKRHLTGYSRWTHWCSRGSRGGLKGDLRVLQGTPGYSRGTRGVLKGRAGARLRERRSSLKASCGIPTKIFPSEIVLTIDIAGTRPRRRRWSMKAIGRTTCGTGAPPLRQDSPTSAPGPAPRLRRDPPHVCAGTRPTSALGPAPHLRRDSPHVCAGLLRRRTDAGVAGLARLDVAFPRGR